MEIIDKNGNTIHSQESKRILAGVLAIVIGPLGIHKFVLGYTTQGLVLLGVSLFTCGIGVFITSIISLIEGIVYLSKSDEAFIHTYQLKKTAWF
ncbi:MAG: TM2 domain-containing protein [Polaribacter sp.]